MSAPSEPPVPESSTGIQSCYRHPGRETGVRCSRCDRPICPDCMIPASVGFQCPECVREGKRSMRPVKTMYGGQLRGDRVAVTRALIGVNVALFLVTALSGGGFVNGNGASSVYDRFALTPPAVAHGEWYRLITSMFLHYTVWHIAFNMWALWVIGGALEGMLGRGRFLALYFLSGLGGAVLSFSFGPVAQSAAGASGAVYGLFSAFFVILRMRNLETGGIAAIIAINLAISFSVPNIDWRAHVGGLIAGAVIAAVLVWVPAGEHRDRVQAIGCAVVAVSLIAASLVGAAHVRHECHAATDPQTAGFCLQEGITPGG